MTKAFTLPLALCEDRLALDRSKSLPAERAGKKCVYRWKEALSLGQYVEPDGRPFQITPERIDRVIQNFYKAKSFGFEPALPQSHKVTEGKNYGYVVDVRKNDKGNLELLHQHLGEDADSEAVNKKSSICLLKEFTDEHGNIYEDLIDHNAIIPNPVLNNLSDFEPALAASRGQVSVVSLTLAANTGELAMPLTAEQKNRIQGFMAAGASIPDDANSDFFIGLLEKQGGDLKLSRDNENKLKSDADKLKGEKDAAESKVLELGRKSPVAKPSASEIYFASTAVIAKRDQAINSGWITPAIADQAFAKFMRKPIDLNKLTLSREVEDDDSKIVAGFANLIDFFDSVQGNKPGPKTGSQTGLQLGRQVPGEDPAKPDPIAQAQAEGKAWQDKQLAARGLK